MSYEKCKKLGLNYKDLKKQIQARPRDNSLKHEPYERDPMVKRNDYTKNISQDILKFGDK